MDMKLTKWILVLFMCSLPVRFTTQATAYGVAEQSNEQTLVPTMNQSPQDLQQLVAPIALYPDALVAQVLAASTYPTDTVEADRWMQSHSNLKGAKTWQAGT
jgi:hypothetical protein